MTQSIPVYSAGQYKPGAVKLSSNESPFPPVRIVRRAISRQSRTAHVYPAMQWYDALTNSIAARHGISPKSVVVGNGSGEVISFICRAFLHKEVSSVTCTHTFSLYEIYSRLAGANVQSVASRDGYYNLPGIQAAITHDTAVVFVCNPNNPTGTAYTADDIISFLRAVPREVYVVLDEAYMDFARPEFCTTPDDVLRAHERTIILRTFSKMYALGSLRLGYGITTEEIARKLLAYKPPFTLNGAAVAAGLTSLLRATDYQKRARIITAERDALYHALTSLGIGVFESNANFLCVDARTDNQNLCVRYPDLKPADRAFAFFANNNIMIRSLTSFGMGTHVRITTGKKRDNKAVLSFMREYTQK